MFEAASNHLVKPETVEGQQDDVVEHRGENRHSDRLRISHKIIVLFEGAYRDDEYDAQVKYTEEAETKCHRQAIVQVRLRLLLAMDVQHISVVNTGSRDLCHARYTRKRRDEATNANAAHGANDRQEVMQIGLLSHG